MLSLNAKQSNGAMATVQMWTRLPWILEERDFPIGDQSHLTSQRQQCGPSCCITFFLDIEQRFHCWNKRWVGHLSDHVNQRKGSVYRGWDSFSTVFLLGLLAHQWILRELRRRSEGCASLGRHSDSPSLKLEPNKPLKLQTALSWKTILSSQHNKGD